MNMRLLMIPMLVLPIAAFAQQAAPAGKPTVRPLSEEEQAFLAKESDLLRQIRLAELQAKLAEAQRKQSGGDSAAPLRLDAPLPLPAGAPATAAPRGADAPAAPKPATPAREEPALSVASVWGASTALNADVLAGGLRMTVRAGDTLPGGWRVLSVRGNGIEVERGKTRRVLMVGG